MKFLSSLVAASLVPCLRAPSRLRAPRTLTRQYTRGRRPSCPSPRTPRENCAYVPARTQTRAAPFQSCAMCVCSVLASYGCPEPPAPATRLSHHQRQAHDHSRRDARAAAPLTEVYAHCTGRLHLLQAPYRTGARRARQDASPRGARGGTPRAQATEHALRYPSRAAVQTACSLHNSPVLNHSARVLPSCRNELLVLMSISTGFSCARSAPVLYPDTRGAR